MQGGSHDTQHTFLDAVLPPAIRNSSASWELPLREGAGNKYLRVRHGAGSWAEQVSTVLLGGRKGVRAGRQKPYM